MSQLFRITLLCVLCVGVFACSSNKDKAESLVPAKLVSFEQTAKLKKVWSASAGSGQDKRYSRFVPLVLGDAVYVADAKGGVFAYNRETGKRLWKVKLGVRTGGAIGGYGSVLLVGTYDAEVIALSILDGQEIWRADASSEILAPPAANDSVAVAQTIDGRIFGYDIETGKKLWSYDHTTPVLTLRGTAAPLMVGNQVIVAFDNGQMVTLAAADGSLAWDARVSQPKGRTELERIVDIDGTPIVEGGLVYAGNYRGNIAAFARAKGQMLWRQDISTHQTLAAANGKVFASTDDSSVAAYDAGSGALLWSNKELFLREIGAPAIIGDYVAVIDKKGYLHLMQQSDGKFAYRFKPKGKGFRSPIVSSDDQLLILSDNGKLTTYRLKSK